MHEGKIFFCGDLHGRFEHLIDAIHQHRPDAVVLAGDIQARRPLDQELADVLQITDVWWVPGNHDTDSDADYDNLYGSRLAERNLHGRVVRIAGVRIAGLGGIFRGQVWMPPDAPRYASEQEYLLQCGKGNYWRGGLPRRHRSSIFWSTFCDLSGQNADVLVSHEAPACHPHGFSQISTLIETLGVRRAFHGHHHESIVYPNAGGCKIIGLGECAIFTLNGDIVI